MFYGHIILIWWSGTTFGFRHIRAKVNSPKTGSCLYEINEFRSLPTAKIIYLDWCQFSVFDHNSHLVGYLGCCHTKWDIFLFVSTGSVPKIWLSRNVFMKKPNFLPICLLLPFFSCYKFRYVVDIIVGVCVLGQRNACGFTALCASVADGIIRCHTAGSYTKSFLKRCWYRW